MLQTRSLPLCSVWGLTVRWSACSVTPRSDNTKHGCCCNFEISSRWHLSSARSDDVGSLSLITVLFMFTEVAPVGVSSDDCWVKHELVVSVTTPSVLGTVSEVDGMLAGFFAGFVTLYVWLDFVFFVPAACGGSLLSPVGRRFASSCFSFSS